ncbi:MAG TPA: YkgJ family cysteine cluster protein [Syntrophobacteraceae bacterium]|nr:YkgJ family cysteine cluster protein [Syntrophobacteraceae bacterium]
MQSFECRRCGRCCKQIGIPWSALDPRKVAAYLDIDLNDFLSRHGFIRDPCSTGIKHPPDFDGTACPFLTYDKETAVCGIYPVRPWICKSYPGPGVTCQAGLQRSER